MGKDDSFKDGECPPIPDRHGSFAAASIFAFIIFETDAYTIHVTVTNNADSSRRPALVYRVDLVWQAL